MSLKVLFVSVEVSPLAKVGGLADVAASLPKQLTALGHDVRVAMPAYPLAEAQAEATPVTTLDSFRVSINEWWHKRAFLKTTRHDGFPVWLIGTDEWFPDVKKSDQIYSPPVDAYLFFSRAVLEACRQMNWIPDVIHCNDWHTGFTPVFMRQAGSGWDETGVVYTIHNLAYQGEFDIEVLDRAGLPRELFNFHQVEAHGRVNFLKSGAVFSDFTNTVSERYAEEIQSEEYGCGLQGLMDHLSHHGRLSGILNGIDIDEWNPATDLRLAANYDADHPAAKFKCREALLQELNWDPIPGAPVAGIVSRVSDQKGMNLLLESEERIRQMQMQVVIQGLGDPWLTDRFVELQRAHPRHFRMISKFDVQLAQHIYSGSDLFLMPSSFEPCGLGQLIAMRYGTIPVVRRTGGLADTVFEGRNGFVFENRNAAEFTSALERAHEAYQDPVAWANLIRHAMTEDHSWSKSASKYVSLYEKAIQSRRKSITLAS